MKATRRPRKSIVIDMHDEQHVICSSGSDLPQPMPLGLFGLYAQQKHEEATERLSQIVLNRVMRGDDLELVMQELSEQSLGPLIEKAVIKHTGGYYQQAVAQDLINKAGLQQATKSAPAKQGRRM